MEPGNEQRAPRLPLGGSCQPNRLTEGESLGILDAAPNEALVVDHHGSEYSACDAFLRAVKPEVAIISVGDNSYGHPAEETLARLQRAGATVYRTDENGNIQLTVHEGEE